MSAAPVTSQSGLDLRVHGGQPALTRSDTWTKNDTVILAGSLLLFFAVPIYCGHGRIFWEDEMLGYMLLRDPSFSHMVSAWKQGADGGGFAFYLTARFWFKVFGASVFAFRLYSQVCFGIAFLLNWFTMRRFYSTGVVAFASLSVWLVSPALVQHMTEGRFYGLLMAAVAAAIWLAAAADRLKKIPAWFYFAVFLVHALVVTSHVLGVAYSFFVLCSMVALDRLRRRWRPLLYLCAALPWLLLIPSRPAIQASARVGKPYFWTQQPGLREFLTNYTGFTVTLGAVIALLLLLVGIGLLSRRRLASTLRRAWNQRTPIYVSTALFFTIPVIFYAEGFFGPALCVSRYLQPVALATSFLVAELIYLGIGLLPNKVRSTRPVWVLCWALFLVALGAYDFVYRPRHTTLQKDYTAILTSRLPRGVPIVCEDAFGFTELIGRQHDSPVKYTYLLDWSNSLAKDAPRLEVTQYHLMDNWRKVGYFSGSIQYAAPFLRQTPLFYSLSFDDNAPGALSGKRFDRATNIGSKLHTHLALDPGYRVNLYETVPLGDLTAFVWRVCRVGSSCG